MKVIIIAAFFAVICFALAIGLEKLGEEPAKQVCAYGIVEGIIVENDGRRRYWISVLVNGEKMIGQTYMYRPTSKFLKEGDEVRVKYTISPRGQIVIRVDDIEMIDGSFFYKMTINVLKIVSLILALTAGALIIKNFM